MEQWYKSEGLRCGTGESRGGHTDIWIFLVSGLGFAMYLRVAWRSNGVVSSLAFCFRTPNCSGEVDAGGSMKSPGSLVSSRPAVDSTSMSIQFNSIQVYSLSVVEKRLKYQ